MVVLYCAQKEATRRWPKEEALETLRPLVQKDGQCNSKYRIALGALIYVNAH